MPDEKLQKSPIEETIEKYKDLDKRCDKILKRIKKRKNNGQEAKIIR
jgi:hypothetical protein